METTVTLSPTDANALARAAQDEVPFCPRPFDELAVRGGIRPEDAELLVFGYRRGMNYGDPGAVTTVTARLLRRASCALLAVPVAAVFLILVALVLRSTVLAGPPRPHLPGGTDAVGRVLFTDYMFAFEVTSILIIVAMVGAVVLARKREN